MQRLKTFQSLTRSHTLMNTVHKYTGKTKDLILGICMAIIIVGVCYVILSPIIGIVSNSVKDVSDLANPLIFLIPENFTMDNIRAAFLHMDYVRTLLSTLAFAMGMTLLHVMVTSMVGYGFARFRFPGAPFLFGLVIITIVVPVQTYMIPLFMHFRFFLGGNINLLGSYWTIGLLTLTGVGLRSGLYIYIFRQFFRGVPKEIEEAAFIDGAGPLSTYTKVMLPNAVPAIVTVTLFAFVWHYNDTFYTSLLVTGNRLMAVMLGMVGLTFSAIENVQDPTHIQLIVFSGVLLAILPILTIYLFLQRYFIEGLERSGIVG